MGSNRLPGKVMMEINSKPLLHYTLNQIRYSKLVKKIIVATTNLPEDDIIEKFVLNEKINCFRGNSKNVLDRYYQCAKNNSLSSILRITADCPLIDPNLIDKVIRKFETGEFDYVSNAFPRTFPYGTEVEIFSFNSLKRSWEKAIKPSEKEHVTPYIKNHPEIFKIGNVQNDIDISDYRWTVDRIEDFELVKQILKKIKRRPIFTDDILKLIQKEPQLKKINNNITPNEGIKKSLKEDNEFLKEQTN